MSRISTSLAMTLSMLLFASMVCGSVASRDWPGWWDHHPNATQQVPKKIVVGDSEHWRFNVSYTDWALKHGPFFINDTLVFKYDPPVGEDAHPHSVYLLPDYKSFENCDLSNAKQVANTTQGGGDGFEFTLDKWQPYYFACGESNGIHCNLGLMKFSVFPIICP